MTFSCVCGGRGGGCYRVLGRIVMANRPPAVLHDQVILI